MDKKNAVEKVAKEPIVRWIKSLPKKQQPRKDIFIERYLTFTVICWSSMVSERGFKHQYKKKRGVLGGFHTQEDAVCLL